LGRSSPMSLGMWRKRQSSLSIGGIVKWPLETFQLRTRQGRSKEDNNPRRVSGPGNEIDFFLYEEGES